MNSILLLEFSGLSIFAVIAIVIVLMALLVMSIIKYRGKKDFARQTASLAEQSGNAKSELDSLFVPSHLVEEKNIIDFQSKYANLLQEIESLKDHKYFDNFTFYESGITSLLSDPR